MSVVTAVPETSLSSLPKVGDFDALIIIADSYTTLDGLPSLLVDEIHRISDVDKRVGKSACLHVSSIAPGGRLVLGATGPLHRHYDDPRRFYDAAVAAGAAAYASGAKRPLVYARRAGDAGAPLYERALYVSALGVISSNWSQSRDTKREIDGQKVESVIGIVGSAEEASILQAMSFGMHVTRYIGGSDPEVTAPPLIEEYLREVLTPLHVDIDVVSDPKEVAEQYPLAGAVGRAAAHVERHRARIVRLTYTGENPIFTLFIAGKGITMDTGGVHVKSAVGMPGMGRDKMGAAAAAGLVATAAALKVPGIRIVALLGFVRNSVGSDAYVPDEIITARSGQRVLITNTDAEGRMVLGDLLAALRELAEKETTESHILSIATLTGHAGLAMGPYSVALNVNESAKRGRLAELLQNSGLVWADPFEVSHVRREDIAAAGPKAADHDLVQCPIVAGSVSLPRGHQIPAAFLGLVSKLEGSRVPFTHIDMAGRMVESGDVQSGRPSCAPLAALFASYVLPRLYTQVAASAAAAGRT